MIWDLFKRGFLVVPIFFLFASNTQAQNREMLLFMDIEPVIVSATKHPQLLKNAPAIATVITDKEIRNMGARNLLDILKRVPGIGVSIVTGYGKFGIESRGIRSIDSENVLVMIDGHRLNDIITGGAMWAFDDMMVENIKRVEIVKGPGSALHGANAFVAVINVVTKEAKDIDGVELRVGGGSYDTKHYNLLFGEEYSGLKIAGTLDYLDSSSARLNVENDLVGSNGETDDWEKKKDVGLKMSYGDLSFNWRYLNKARGAYIGIINALNDESRIDTSHMFGELIYKHSFGEDISFLAKGYYDEYYWKWQWEVLPENIVPPDGIIGIPEAKNRIYGSEIQLDYSMFKNNICTVGIVYESDRQYNVKQSLNFDPTAPPWVLLGSVQDVTSWGNWNQNRSRYVSAAYIQDIWQVTPEIEATIGLRHDHYSDFGGTTNPRFGLVWNFSEKTNLKLLYGSAFRAPNFKELYNTNNPIEKGNSDLKPEEIDTYEGSIAYRFNKNYSANLTYFYSAIREHIIIDNTQFKNLGRVKVDGIEAELRGRFKNSTYGYINYTYQKPEDKVTGDKLHDVATHRGNIGASTALATYFNVNLNILLSGERPREQGDPRDSLAGYALADLTLTAKDFYPDLEVRFAVKNLLDKRYADPSPVGTLDDDFPREGINYMLDALYKF